MTRVAFVLKNTLPELPTAYNNREPPRMSTPVGRAH